MAGRIFGALMCIIVGFVFFLVGLFGVVGLWISGEMGAALAMLLFVLFGGMFVVIGTNLQIQVYKDKQRCKELVEIGALTGGVIIDFIDDWSMMVNDTPSYRFVVKCESRDQIFISEAKMPSRKDPKLGDQVDLYLRGNDAAVQIGKKFMLAEIAQMSQ